MSGRRNLDKNEIIALAAVIIALIGLIALDIHLISPKDLLQASTPITPTGSTTGGFFLDVLNPGRSNSFGAVQTQQRIKALPDR